MKIQLPIDVIPAKRVYLLYGYDQGLLLDALNKIRSNFEHAKRISFINFNQFSNYWHNHANDILHRDLFVNLSVDQILEINIGNGKFSSNQLNVLRDFFMKIKKHPNIVVILLGENFSAAETSSKWVKYIDEIGIILTSKNLSINMFKTWVANQFKQFNVRLTPEALTRFVEEYHNNFLAAKQNIHKIQISYNLEQTDPMNHPSKVPLKELGVIELLNYIDLNQAKYSLYDLQYALKYRDRRSLSKILKNLQDHDTPSTLVLWGIIKVIEELTAKSEKSPELIKIIAKLWQKSAIIDLEIKQFEQIASRHNLANKNSKLELHSDLNSNTYKDPEYIWGLFQEICMEYVCHTTT